MKITKEVLKSGSVQYTARWEEESRFYFPLDLPSLEKILSSLGSHYFDDSTRRFFKSRELTSGVLRVGGEPRAFFFVESVRFGYEGASREYRVCMWVPEDPRSITRVFKGSRAQCNRRFDRYVRGEEVAPTMEAA